MRVLLSPEGVLWRAARVCARGNVSFLLRPQELCRTLAGNPCHVITITASTPDPEELRRRKGVVITSRVHPGETNASWMMHGLLEFLTSNAPEARLLRQHLVRPGVPVVRVCRDKPPCAGVQNYPHVEPGWCYCWQLPLRARGRGPEQAVGQAVEAAARDGARGEEHDATTACGATCACRACTRAACVSRARASLRARDRRSFSSAICTGTAASTTFLCTAARGYVLGPPCRGCRCLREVAVPDRRFIVGEARPTCAAAYAVQGFARAAVLRAGSGAPGDGRYAPQVGGRCERCGGRRAV